MQYNFANGDVYEGEYVRGRKEGRGTYKSIVGAVYKGEYKAGAKDGYGVFVYRDETRYEGTFANNVKEGQGIMSSPFFPRPQIPTARAERRKAIAGTTPTAPSTSATTTTA